MSESGSRSNSASAANAAATGSAPDPQAMGDAMGRVAAQTQRMWQEFLERQMKTPPAGGAPGLDPGALTVLGQPFQRYVERIVANPQKVIEAQMGLWQDYMKLWENMGRRLTGQEVEPVIEPEKGDRRFRDPEWKENPIFDFIKQSYLLTCKYLLSLARAAEGLDEKTARQIDFYTRQFADALSPTNFVVTNPAVIRETVKTGGQNLIEGFRNLLEDLEAGEGQLRIRMTDTRQFELGRNVAVTPGKVIYQNELMQLLQYEPSTEQVYRRPLLIVPPWINKYYILDLRPENSFIKWAVDQGHTVFVISWANPDASLARKSFDDYLLEGPMAALGAIEQATGEAEANLVGYCLGGTLLACAMAYEAARGESRIRSGTFFASLVDFSEPGELGVFIDEEQVALLERQMQEKGYLEGSQMATAFNMLRANDLIWSFVVNNYLLGKDPVPFDLLYWNSDSTRMPAAMHSFYLRNMYLGNKLVEPGGISLAQTPIDLRKIEAPTYIVAAREDHIAPWKSTYAATRLYSGPKRFVLGGSGHIAGIVNPPAANKYEHWTNPELPPTPEEWLAGATRHPGSWWPDWKKWVARLGGRKVPARHPGDGALPPIEDAPGSYVRVRA